MKNNTVVRDYFILPCCLLLLNLCNTIVTYKAGVIHDAILRTACIIAMVLFGSSVVAFAVSPAISSLVGWTHHATRRKAGKAGELLFLGILGLLVFWLYYRVSTFGPASILPSDWRNARR
jgi:hypothetical protein